MSSLQVSLTHLKKDIKYPATTKQLLEACSNMSDVPKPDRDWITKTLPQGTYKSPEEVVKAILGKV